MTKLTLALAVMLLATTAPMAWADNHEDDDEAEEAAAAPAQTFGARTLELGFAGLMDNRNRTELQEISLTAGAMQSAGEYELLSGGYYRISIGSDGTQELAVEGPNFFRNIWINEIVINDIEIRPLGGIDSIEFDAAGSARISFIAVVPGSYEFRIRGASGESQRATFHIR
jgi:hypothetical protein